MKMAMVIAACLIVVGLLIGFVSLASVGFDFKRLQPAQYDTAEYTVEEPFSRVAIEHADIFDVTLLPSEDGLCKVVSDQTEKLYATPTVEEGTLRIEMIDARKWYDHIFSFYSVKVVVYLPEQVYESITVRGTTSDVSVSSVVANTLSVKSTTGDIRIADVVATESIHVAITTGDLSVSSIHTGDLSVSTTTGDVSLSHVTADVASVEVTTGDISLSRVMSAEVHFKTTTGDVSLSDVQAAQQLYGDTTTGSVTLDRCDSIDIWIATGTGDIRGSICTEKIFVTKTNTGDVDVPQSGTGNICRLETTTGDIEITIG